MLDLREDEPLAPRTTFGVGGAARWFVEVADDAALDEARRWSRDRGVDLFVLGGGSNLLVSDRGLDALVVRPALRGLELAGESGGVTSLSVGAGERWDDVVELSVREGLVGLECLSGIPGDAGATPIQNVGAYGQEVAETIVAVERIDLETGARSVMRREDCGFGYRTSVFKGALRGRSVVTRVRFDLARGGESAARYPELARALGDRPATPGHVRDTVLALRRSKSMVLDPADENFHSAGSFFTNPIVDRATAEHARDVARGLGHDAMPSFDAPGGLVKLSAAWLIERAGFARGTTRGRAGISTRHSLALVNRGGATALEIVTLAAEVQAGVRERFGVRITPEPELVGFSGAELDAVGLDRAT